MLIYVAMQVQLDLVEQQAQMRLAQKTAELQLLQRRMRDEARATVEAETRRADGLKRQLEDRHAFSFFLFFLQKICYFCSNDIIFAEKRH